MAKYPRVPKLTPKEQEQLLLEFCEAMLSLKSLKEVVNFLKDIFTKQEIEMISKRLRVARLLLEGKTYEEIRNSLKVSHGTISRVNVWLKISGEGYRLVVGRTKPAKECSYEDEIKEMNLAYKKKYPMYFWPELLYERITKDLSQRKKEEVKKALRAAESKEDLYKIMDRLLTDRYKRRHQLVLYSNTT